MKDGVEVHSPERITVIVGAGISVPAPTAAPDFQALRDRFLRLADPGLDPADFALDELSPEQVFDAIDDGSDELRAAVRRELWWLCEPNEPNANHYAVAALLGVGTSVWTPNFDTMIERAAARESTTVRAVTPGDSMDKAGSEPLLFKPHGSFPYMGDPPREPAGHDYRLLFQASAVWLLEAAWSERLTDDIRGRDVFVFGYRGADPDLTPIMLRAFEQARSVSWWEFGAARNFARLERLLHASPSAIVHPGDPSVALQRLAQTLAPHTLPAQQGVALSRPTQLETIKLSNVSRSQLLGQFRGSAVARRYLRRAVLFDSPANRRLALFRLVRSTGFDISWARALLLLVLGGALRIPRVQDRPRVSELYAIMIDARPIRRGDRRALRRLLGLPGPAKPAILIRVASVEKLHGDLDAATMHANETLRAVERRPHPRLEAMTVYNLAWTYRQRGEFERRAQLIERYADRLPHIGFNWAAWLGLDEVLVALHLGDTATARESMNSPFLTYARSLIKHPMYALDDSLTEALVRWHEHGPTGIDDALQEILRLRPVRAFGHPPFTALDTLIVSADHARAVGDGALMRHRIRRARRRTSSALQEAEIQLVEEVAADDPVRLRRFRDEAARCSFGLIAQTAEAVLAHIEGPGDRTPSIVYRPDLPLAGTY